MASAETDAPAFIQEALSHLVPIIGDSATLTATRQMNTIKPTRARIDRSPILPRVKKGDRFSATAVMLGPVCLRDRPSI
jgi:hypothetical protein